MKQGSTFILRGAIIAIGLVVLVLCFFVLPLGISSDVTGLYRPILIGLYIPALPFFFALYQAMKLLGYIDKNLAFSELCAVAFANIKYCAIAISALFALGMPYIFMAADKDDAPGVVVIGLVITFASLVIATFAGLLQKLVQSAVAIKNENDLTV
jgi:hypothetical protein